MKKSIIQGIFIIALFFSIYGILSMVDWISFFKIETITEKSEAKIGDLFWKMFQENEKENKNAYLNHSVDSIIDKICFANKIDRKIVKLHIVNKAEINAFALPGGHLVVYSGLITHSENQEELSGVLCHEIGHIALNQVMKKLVKEVGISVLISMSTGNTGTQVIRETAKKLSSTAFDRSMEKEADLKAVDFMIQAEINPLPFADFLNTLADKEPEDLKYFSWINTHPDSKERSKYIIEYAKGKSFHKKSILHTSTWEKIKKDIQE